MVALTVHYTDYTEVRVVRHSDVTWRGTPDIESQVANYILRSQENPNWSNEPLVRVNTSRIIGCQLQLETSLTDYAHHVVTRSTVEDDLRANGLYVSAMLRTLDKQFLFARRADVDIRRNKYNIVAGGVNPTTDMVLSKPSLQRGLQRELREEFGPVIAGSAFSYIPRMILALTRNQR